MLSNFNNTLIKSFFENKKKFLSLKIRKKRIEDFFSYKETNFILASKFNEDNFYNSKNEIFNFLNSNKNIISNNLIKNIFLFIKIFFKGYFFLIKFFFINNYLKSFKINKETKSDLIFLNYFFNYDKKKIKKNQYISHYWQHIPELTKKNFEYEFLHQVYLNKKINFIDIKILNKIKKKNHTFLESFINFFDFLKIIFSYTKLSIYYFYLFLLISNKFGNNNFFIFFKKLFIESISGVNLMRNLIYYFQFKNFLRVRKNIKTIFFLFENLTWEKIFIDILISSRPEIKLYYYIHTPVRYLDLKLKTLHEKERKKDKILLTSTNDLKNLKPYLPQNYFYVENLRLKKIHKSNNKNHKNSFLILFGFDTDENNKIINLLNKLDTKYLKFINLKTHPALDVKISQKIQKNCKIEKNDMPHIIKKNIYQKFIVAGDSSVGFDMIINNMQFAIFDLNKYYFSGSLRKNGYIHFIKNYKQLKTYLFSKKKMYLYNKKTFYKLNKTIYSNPALDNWKNLINNEL